MADTNKPWTDLKVHCVSLHGRGKPEYGTLYLYRHHLVFKYTPQDQKSASLRAASGSQLSYLSPRESASLDNGHRHSNESAARRAAPKPQSKEMWIPYPLINYCMFRPTNTAGLRSWDYGGLREEEREGPEEGAFPPVYGTNSLERPSTDSARISTERSPRPSQSRDSDGDDDEPLIRIPTIRIRRRDFQMMAFHFHQDSHFQKSPNDKAREVFYCLRNRCVVDKVQDMHAFHFKAPREELNVADAAYDARREFARMGIGGKAAEGPGSAWRITDINQNYEYSPTYPSVLCVPQTVSDNILKYGGAFRSKARIPALTYLHFNGGSISRSSQPMVGLKSKRNPQDERLVSAIFSSHTPSNATSDDVAHDSHVREDSKVPRTDQLSTNIPILQSETALNEKFSEVETSAPVQRVYGSTRTNLIVDARPKMNAIANLTGGGGFEDVSNYPGPPGTVVERTFLGIANIHVMRKSLDRVIESFANSDYLDLKPNSELLRNSGWLTHIGGLLNSAEMVARAVGLGGSHVLVHCSDGWDRTSQVAALAEIMLDPHYRTLSGFITLVQKDFMSFGHKFNHRHGIQGSEKWFEIENERVMPSRPPEGDNNDSSATNTFGAKALSGAKNWFEKNRNNLFRAPHENKAEYDNDNSRPPSPPPNSVLHSPATSNTKKDKEHKTELQEIAPIFQQFLDALFQIQYHFPNAFEFNERFLRRLFYQAYAGQYGEFLFNTEKARVENAGKFASAWPHFLSRKHEFTNPNYAPHVDEALLFPSRQSQGRDFEVRWWSALFGRKDEDMNTPRSLAPPDLKSDTSNLSSQLSSASLGDGDRDNSQRDQRRSASTDTTRNPRRIPSQDALGYAVDRQHYERSAPTEGERARAHKGPDHTIPPVVEHDRESESPATHLDPPHAVAQTLESSTAEPAGEGDPLGVSTKVNELSGGRLDFAAFARESAYSDR